MTNPWTRRIITISVAIAVIGGFAWALRTKPIPVDIGKVTEGPLTVSIRQDGVTRVRNVFVMSTPIAGHLARTMIEEGDRVEAGKSVIAEIHPLDSPLIDKRTKSELEAARGAAAAALTVANVDRERAVAALNLVEKAYERASQLSVSGVIPASQFDKAQSEVKLQRAILEAADATITLRQAELASAEARLLQPAENGPGPSQTCCVRLTAPISGVVLSVAAKSEQPVQVGTRIAEIGDPSDLEIVVDLLSSDAVQIKPGMPVRILNWGGDKVLSAHVRRIEPTGITKISALGIEEQRVATLLDLDETDPRLGHGFRVTAEMAIWSSPKVVRVPIPALFRIGNDWAVFSLVDGHVSQTKVTVGHMNDQDAEVLSGLKPGETVVVHPSDTLADGVTAEPRAQ